MDRSWPGHGRHRGDMLDNTPGMSCLGSRLGTPIRWWMPSRTKYLDYRLIYTIQKYSWHHINALYTIWYEYMLKISGAKNWLGILLGYSRHHCLASSSTLCGGFAILKWSNVDKTKINHQFGNGSYHLFMVKLAMVYYCFTNITMVNPIINHHKWVLGLVLGLLGLPHEWLGFGVAPIFGNLHFGAL